MPLDQMMSPKKVAGSPVRKRWSHLRYVHLHDREGSIYQKQIQFNSEDKYTKQ